MHQLSITEQRELDILIKELRLKADALEMDTDIFNSATRDYMRAMIRTILLIESKLN